MLYIENCNWDCLEKHMCTKAKPRSIQTTRTTWIWSGFPVHQSCAILWTMVLVGAHQRLWSTIGAQTMSTVSIRWILRRIPSVCGTKRHFLGPREVSEPGRPSLHWHLKLEKGWKDCSAQFLQVRHEGQHGSFWRWGWWWASLIWSEYCD